MIKQSHTWKRRCRSAVNLYFGLYSGWFTTKLHIYRTLTRSTKAFPLVVMCRRKPCILRGRLVPNLEIFHASKQSWLVNDFGFSPPSASFWGGGNHYIHKNIHTHLTAGVDLLSVSTKLLASEISLFCKVCGFFLFFFISRFNLVSSSPFQ